MPETGDKKVFNNKGIVRENLVETLIGRVKGSQVEE